jgi:hypothetical protein
LIVCFHKRKEQKRKENENEREKEREELRKWGSEDEGQTVIFFSMPAIELSPPVQFGH